MPLPRLDQPARPTLTTLTDDLGLLYGGDYNPEQWTPEVWREDIALMRQARVNLVTVGVFSWARYEPEPGAREFTWLDEVLDLLAAAGIAVDLATPTASPPPWLGVEHPETLPVTADGVRLAPGSRNQFSPSSQVYRERAVAITRDLAARYAKHPAVRMWHIGNEYGQVDFGEEAAREFRSWLSRKYGSIGQLNAAWGTDFWSQRYRSFADVQPPRRAPYLLNPTQNLDFRRFSSDQMLACYREQYQAIRAAGGTQPITTNLMGFFEHVDAWAWAADLDVVADDQYPDPGDPLSPCHFALVQDLMRGLGAGAPWVLMEQAAGATSWREHNQPKTPARLRLDSLQAVAHGADAICFFQWRASKAGAERFHSAMLPHAGADTALHRGIRRLGADLERLRPLAGSRVPARVALVFDWESWWAAEEPGRITERLSTLDQVRAWYRPLWERGVAVDVVPPEANLDAYDVVLVPQCYLLSDDAASGLRGVAARGGHLAVGPMTGVADENAQVLPGRFPVQLADVLGVSGEEWVALPPNGLAVRGIGAGAGAIGLRAGRATIHGELLRADTADVWAQYTEGYLDGVPVVTRRAAGTGSVADAARDSGAGGAAWYLGAVLDVETLDRVISTVLDEAGVASALAVGLGGAAAASAAGAATVSGAAAGSALPNRADDAAVDAVVGDCGSESVLVAARQPVPGLEVARRGEALFLLNRGRGPVSVSVAGPWRDLLTDANGAGQVTVPPQDARVLVPA